MPHFCRFCGATLKNSQGRFCLACGRQLGEKQPHLVIRIPGQPLREAPLNRPAFTIGRKPDNDIVLSPKYVSGHHGRLERRGTLWHYVDLGSTNGTFANGQRLVRPHLLQRGDVVQIGPFKLVYEAAGFQQYAATGGMRLDGVHLTRDVGRGAKQKRILEDISISVYPRDFVALVGASGAGKSTLLMALNGFARAQGQMLVRCAPIPNATRFIAAWGTSQRWKWTRLRFNSGAATGCSSAPMGCGRWCWTRRFSVLWSSPAAPSRRATRWWRRPTAPGGG